MDLLKEFSFLFGRDRMKSAFRSVKRDMDYMNADQRNLKLSLNEWIQYLNQENQMLKARVLELEQKLSSAESVIEDEELCKLRGM